MRVKIFHQEHTQSGGIELLSTYENTQDSFIWIDMENEDLNTSDINKRFNLHALAVIDAHRERHPPKVEYFDDHIFTLQRDLKSGSEELDIEMIQIAMFIGEDFLITRHNVHSSSIETWWNNPFSTGLMQHNPALLASRIMNTMASHYLETMLIFEPSLSEIEDMIGEDSDDNLLYSLISYKTRLRKLRRIFSYHERVAATLLEHQKKLNDDDEVIHNYQDVYEKYERLHSLSSMYYELTGDLIEGHISLASHRLNKTMQVLTVITAVFVPLSFLAGVYGMNFDIIPELHYEHGYFVLIGFMLTIALSLIWLFRRRKWL
jgi:magnesium transporter